MDKPTAKLQDVAAAEEADHLDIWITLLW